MMRGKNTILQLYYLYIYIFLLSSWWLSLGTFILSQRYNVRVDCEGSISGINESSSVDGNNIIPSATSHSYIGNHNVQVLLPRCGFLNE